ncbi:MAG: 50S ribosomal protein L11 methyltransferase, partial [Rhodobacteraceae bacterium]|nr:50S ribosomal protein L11 methyltransferase [Paracoccaceae bacterium]
MPFHQAITPVAGESAAQALADAIEALDPLATELRDHDDGSGRWDVGAQFAGPPDVAALALLAHLHGAPDFAVARVEDRDWVAQVRAELT